MPVPNKLRPRPQLPTEVKRLPPWLLIALIGLLAASALSSVINICASFWTYTLLDGPSDFGVSEQEWDGVNALHQTADRLGGGGHRGKSDDH